MRHAISAAVLAASLIAGPGLARPPAEHPANGSMPAAPATSTTPADEEKISPADRKRIQAIQQYQHDLVSVVALRADPDYLLGAAILAKPFENQTQGLDFDALSQRAASAPSAGAPAEWARLDVCKTEKDCPNTEAFAWLKKHATDNAAVWMVALDVAARDKNEKAERAALKQAAAAQSYDDYYGNALAGVAKAVAVLPPLADTMQGAHDGQPDNDDGVRLLVAVMNTQNHIRPAFGPLEQLCGDDAAKDADLKDDCLKLARTLQWGSSPIARAVGLHIQATLKPVEKAQNDQASRNLAWQVHQYSGLLQRALTDASLASQWLATARNGGTELSLMRATLRANQVPLDAPAPASAGSAGQ